MPNKDRESFLMLLERLGSTDDAEVVKAAREIAQRLAASGLTWEDLLRPPTSPTIELTGDDAALIDRLLDHPKVSEATREELHGIRRDLAQGQIDPIDRKYVHDLARRIGG
jgi:hypothetical protein